MRKKLKRIFSITMCLALVLTMLPTMAFAAGETYPSHVTVNNGVQLSGAAFFKNNDTEGNLTGNASDYNAKYDSNMGILELKDYNGGTIATTGNTGKTTTIKISGTNNITDSREGIKATGGDSVVITSDGEATLNITISGQADYEQSIAGIMAYIWGNPTGSVTVKGDVKLVINVTTASTNAYANAVGIYAANGITIEDNAKVTVKCRNTTNESSTNVGLFTDTGSNQKITFNTTDDISVDVSESNGYSFAVRSSNYDMTKAGLVTLKWNPGVANNGGKLYRGDDAFNASNWAINIDNTNHVATYKYGTPYTVNVFGGRANMSNGKYVKDETVSLTAHQSYVEKFGFKKWASDDITIANATNATASFAMPTKDVSVIAYYNIFTAEPKFERLSDNTGKITYALKEAPSQVKWCKTNGEQVDTFGNSVNGNQEIGTFKTPTGTYYIEFTIDGGVYRSEPIAVDYSDTTPPELTFEDKAEYDIPEGTQGVSYTAATVLTATGGTTPYTFTVDPAVTGLSINDENKLVYTRPTVQAATTATIKVTDSDNNSKTIEIAIGAVTASTTTSATVANVTIDGRTGASITDADVTITLANDTFTDTISGNWITNLPSGLTQSVSRTDGTTAKIAISGTPTASSTDAITITIPAEQLMKCTENLTVTANENAKFDIKTSIAVPTVDTGLTYDGTVKTGVNTGTGYTLTNNTATNAGNHTATATLADGYAWSDDVTDTSRNIAWSIKKRTPVANDFDFKAPTELTYSNANKEASVTLKSSYTECGNITLVYEKNSSVVTETKDAGEYTVKINVEEGTNFNAASNLTDATSWKFTITKANQTAPTLSFDKPSADGVNDGKITGLVATKIYEYKASAESTYKTVTSGATEITGLAAGKYNVRLKETENYNASANTDVTIPEYSAATYTVTFNVDGGSTVDTQNVTAGGKATRPSPDPTKSGYTFAGWYKDSTFITEFDFNTVINAATTIYAKWTAAGGSGGGSGSGGGGFAPTPAKAELKVDGIGGKATLSSDGKTATITPDAGYVVKDVTVNGVSKGAVDKITDLKATDKVVVTFEKEAEKPAKPTEEQVKEILGNIKSKARSEKTAKGNIKITFSIDKGDLAALIEGGYTVKYKYYRSTKKASKYKAMKEGTGTTYTNTTGKKGTRYYYKVRVMVYDGDNLIDKTELKNCKYATRVK